MKYKLYDIEKKKELEYNENEVLDQLYLLKARLPDNLNKKEMEKLKHSLSKIDIKIPLYDIKTDNMYLIDKCDIYDRVIRQQYRFPDNILYKNIIKKKEKYSNKNILDETEKILNNRIIHKMDLIINYLDNFDLNELENTYIRVFYFSDDISKNLTQCTRPSFNKNFSHINPYYSKTEIENLAKNMEIKISDYKNLYESEKLIDLCEAVKLNDVSSNILLKHQKYMIEENKVGLIQYYTLHGSYNMNKYLRNLEPYPYKNEYLETMIKSMWKLINNAPAFDKDYILYRFINNDEYLRDIEIGETFSDNGFTSTTRDPFYRSDLYKFGFILIKIKIPADIKGIGLCVETLSHFPDEQEIILGPKCILKLNKKDTMCKYYHIDKNFSMKVKTKYEMTVVSISEDIQIDKKEIYTEKQSPIDFLNIKNITTFSLQEKIRFFINNYVNPMHQCDVKIGNKNFTIFNEFYNSTTVYKPYYAITTQNGFSMYCIYDNYVLFFIELGENNNNRKMSVNFFSRYNTLEHKKYYSDEDFIAFIAKISYYFEVPYVKLHCDFKSCDFIHTFNKNNKDINLRQRGFNKDRLEKEQNTMVNNTKKAKIDEDNQDLYVKFGGIYCDDYYNYLKYKIKKYHDIKILNIELIPAFSFYQLDKLQNTDPIVLFNIGNSKSSTYNVEINDELYQVYTKIYKGNKNLKDYYIWIIENRCFLINKLVNKISNYFKFDSKNNPFVNSYYNFDTNSYLYNRNYIKTFPDYIKDTTRDFQRGVINVDKNEYRITEL